MRLTGAALLGFLIPGIGHLLLPRRRLAVLFLLPVVVLVVAVVAVLASGGIFGLAAVLVTPGVLPALAVLNVALAAWRILSGVDAVRRLERSRRAAALASVAALVLVVVPHVIVGRTIASTNELLDSLFASASAEPSDPGQASPEPAFTAEPTLMDISWMVLPTDVELVPGWSPDASLDLPSPSPPRRRLGGTPDPLPPLGVAVPWKAPGAIPWGDDGRFSLLLLGSDAGSDRWSRRMDTMLLVEVDVATGQTSMVGIPRNLYNAPFPPGPARDAVPCGCLQGLLNEAYQEAVSRHPERWPGSGAVSGIGAVRAIVSELTGRPIDAVLVADLMGVVRVVDAMGGLDINVPSSVYDPNYPDPVLGKIELYIRAGQQHFDGRLALAYARSRHQDSDYGRMARQQTLLLAIRSQLGVATILSAPDLVAASKGATWTDLPRESLPNLVQLFGKAANARVQQLRIVPPTYPSWLTPSIIAKIQAAVAALLPPVPTPTPTPEPSPEPTASTEPPPSVDPSASPSPSGSSDPTASPTPGSGSPPPSGSASPSPSPSISTTPSSSPGSSADPSADPSSASPP